MRSWPRMKATHSSGSAPWAVPITFLSPLATNMPSNCTFLQLALPFSSGALTVLFHSCYENRAYAGADSMCTTEVVNYHAFKNEFCFVGAETPAANDDNGDDHHDDHGSRRLAAEHDDH